MKKTNYPRIDRPIRWLGVQRCNAVVSAILLVIMVLCSGLSAIAQNTYYVNASNSSPGDGLSWGGAFADLQQALAVASSGDQIWVSKGVYKPTADPANREATFLLKNGVEVYGGFVGTESTLDGRNWQTNVTVLSGDIDGDDTGTDGIITDPVNQIKGGNSYTVVTASGVSSTAVLDGFVITGGSADDAAAGNTAAEKTGGGIYNSTGSPTLRNLDIRGNQSDGHGAGIYISGGITKLTGSKIRNNRGISATAAYGGGIYITGGKLAVVNTEIANNTASHGGGFQDWGLSESTLTNVLVYGNTAVGSAGCGGVRGRQDCKLTLTNVTIVGNRAAGAGPGLQSPTTHNLTVHNSIVWGNLDLDGVVVANSNSGTVNVGSHNLIQTTATGVGNITGIPSGLTVDDIFVASSDGNYALLAGNLAIDAGSNERLWEGIQLAEGHSNPMPGNLADAAWGTDLAGGARILTNTVDLGAYEHIPSAVPALRVFWNGDAVPSTGLELSYGDQGTLTVTTTGDAVPTMVSDPLLSLSSATGPAEATALTIGTGQLTVTSAETNDFEEAILILDVRIAPKELIVTADAVSKSHGENDPPLTFTVEGLVNNDQSADILTGALTRQGGEDKGIYPIEQGTLAIVESNENYTLRYVGENFIINGLSQEITFDAPELVELRTGVLALTVSSSSGLPVTLVVDDASVASLSGTNLNLHTIGTVVVTATQEGNGMYEPAEPVRATIRIIDDLVRVHPAVSPDGNGINDFLRIEGIEKFPDNQVTIFDRTGKVLDRIFGYDNHQNIFTGEKLRHGTYFYRVSVTVNGERRNYQGFFELKRKN